MTSSSSSLPTATTGTTSDGAREKRKVDMRNSLNSQSASSDSALTEQVIFQDSHIHDLCFKNDLRFGDEVEAESQRIDKVGVDLPIKDGLN